MPHHIGRIHNNTQFFLLFILLFSYILSLSSTASTLSKTSYDINQIATDASSKPDNLVVYDQKLFFTAKGRLDGQEGKIWSYDSQSKKHIIIVASSKVEGSVENLQVHDNKLYFSVKSSDKRSSLWHYDSKSKLAVEVAFIEKSKVIDKLIPWGDDLFIILREADTWAFNGKLFKLNKADGKLEVTLDFNLASNEVELYNDQLYFIKNISKDEYELWSYNKHNNAQVRISKALSSDSSMQVHQGELFFCDKFLWNGDGSGSQSTWTYQSETKSILKVSDACIRDFVAHKEILYFGGYQQGIGNELLAYNTNTKKTTEVPNSNTQLGYCPDPEFHGCSSSPRGLIIFNNKLHFFGAVDYDGRTTQFFQYDLSTQQLDIIYRDFPVNGGVLPPVLYDNHFYFPAGKNSDADYFAGAKNVELYSYSIDTNEAALVIDINKGTGGSRPSDFTEYHEKIYFSADDGVNGRELWVYDYQTDSPYLVEDLSPGERSGYLTPNSSNPHDLTVYDDKLIFKIRSSEQGSGLIAFDYKDSISQLIFKLNDEQRFISTLVEYSGQLYFATTEPTSTTDNLSRLWRYNGESDTVQQILEYGNDFAYKLIENLIEIDDKLFFTTSDGDSVDELWSYSSVTQQKTLLNEGLNITEIVRYHETLYFTNSYLDAQGSTSVCLWRYDHDKNIAEKVTELPFVESYIELTVFAEHLIMIGRTPAKLESENKTIDTAWAYQNGTNDVRQLNTLGYSNISSPTVIGGELFIEAPLGQLVISQDMQNTSIIEQLKAWSYVELNNVLFSADYVNSASKGLGLELVNVKLTGTPALISGEPELNTFTGELYSFTPIVSEYENDLLTFSVENKPSWALFNSATGELYGTPDTEYVGKYKDIVISVNDGVYTTRLAAFDVSVIAQVINPPVIVNKPASSGGGANLLFIGLILLLLPFRKVNCSDD